DLAVVEGELAGAAEAAELADDAPGHRLGRTGAEEAAVLVLDLPLGGGRGLLGLALDGAVEPGVEGVQFGRVQLVQARGAEFLRGDLRLNRGLRGQRRGDGEQGGEEDAA